MERGLKVRSGFRAVVLVAVGGLSMPGVLAGAAGLAMAGAAAAQEAEKQGAAASLPIRGITLYRSGVGYFERHGMVDGNEKIQLRFATDQINDIIKSMIILDRGGGRIDGVSYGSKEPLSKRLSSFGVDISDSPDVAKLLSRLRGAPVRVVTQDGNVTGTVLGVETRPVGGGKDQEPVPTPFVNLVTETGIRSFDLTRASSFEILDKDLAEELGKALSALAEHRADRVKTVDLSFSGNGAREAIVAYVHEMPVWKTSYRLVLPEIGEGKTEGQPMIQGWAIVENTTDEDWEDVRLSLVAGRPVSFQMDLYEPLFVQRPEVQVPFMAGVMPKVYQGGAAFDRLSSLTTRAKGLPPPAAAPADGLREGAARLDLRQALESSQQGGGGGNKSFGGLSGDDLARYTAQSQAEAGNVGEVFQYQLRSPVSIARQRSAMLPILNANTDGRRVSIYNRGDNAEHPMRGVEIKNSTGMQLMPGPLSVFDGAAYAGDAQIGHITTGDKRLLSYAVDLDVLALVKDDHQSTIGSIKIVNGLIHQTVKQVAKVAYAFDNKDQKRPRTILVEQPKAEGWKLVTPEKPAEETQALYRFEAKIDAAAAGKLDIVQERTDLERIAVTNYDLGTLAAYAKQGKVSKAVMEAVQKAADMQAAINQTQRGIERLDQERQAIFEDQTRVRQNMQAIRQDTDLYRNYMTEFTNQEARLKAIKTEREELQTQMQKQQNELQAYIRGLNVE